jgi:hypothetical protein
MITDSKVEIPVMVTLFVAVAWQVPKLVPIIGGRIMPFVGGQLFADCHFLHKLRKQLAPNDVIWNLRIQSI